MEKNQPFNLSEKEKSEPVVGSMYLKDAHRLSVYLFGLLEINGRQIKPNQYEVLSNFYENIEASIPPIYKRIPFLLSKDKETKEEYGNLPANFPVSYNNVEALGIALLDKRVFLSGDKESFDLLKQSYIHANGKTDPRLEEIGLLIHQRKVEFPQKAIDFYVENMDAIKKLSNVALDFSEMVNNVELKSKYQSMRDEDK